MRNRFLIGLFTTAVLLFAAPVAASEVRSSVQADVLDIQSMIQSSQQRQGILQSELIPAPAPVATTAPAPVATTAPAPVATTAPAPVATTAPAPVATTAPAPVATTAPAPVATTAPAPVATTAPAPVATTAPAPILASTPVPYDSSTEDSVHTTEYTSAPAPDPTREQQWNNKSFMWFVSDLAWQRVDDKSDYSLGAMIERGFLSPLAVIRVYAPHMMPKALAILRGEETYA